MVRCRETILIPASMKDELMDMLHHHPAHGHRGGLATYRILSDHYYWPGMHTAIRQVVASCQMCNARQSHNTFTPYKSRLLFQQISLDFAGLFGPNIKRSHYKYCLVIVDQLSLFPILVPCKANNAQVIINALQNRVYANNGLPESSILDRAGRTSAIQTHNDGGIKRLPARWWDRHGGRATVIKVLPHNQYLIRNAVTGNEIIRSGHTLAKIPQ